MMFNPKTSNLAEGDVVTDKLIVCMAENYLNDRLKYNGYLYLNQIYEQLRLRWDPERDNRCYIYENGDRIDLGFIETEDGIELRNI